MPRAAGTLSIECWGGATFDVAMRFLAEDPWERSADISASAVPNVLLQMLLRGSNAVGYTNYPDNVVKFFVRQAGRRRRRSLPRLRLPELGREHARLDGRGARAGKLCEGAICYTGDILDPTARSTT
jgi:pyruvate carboxylase